jgi:hypothetical protein
MSTAHVSHHTEMGEGEYSQRTNATVAPDELGA